MTEAGNARTIIASDVPADHNGAHMLSGAIEAHRAADAAWHQLLVATYGRHAGDARYDARGRATHELATLADAKVRAAEAEHHEWERLRELVGARQVGEECPL